MAPSTDVRRGGPRRFRVFLSHSMKDAEHVEQVRRQLLALGIEVWLAEHDPRPGSSILAKIEDEMAKCDVVVFLITANSVDSAYVQQEVGMARAHELPMVPLVDVAVDRGRLGLLGELEWLQIDLQNPAEALARVTQSLQPLIVQQVRDIAARGSEVSGLVLVGLAIVLGLLLLSYGSTQTRA